MEKQLSPRTMKLIEEISKKLNMNSELFIEKAVKSYIKDKELEEESDKELEEEMKMWEEESAKELSNFLEKNDL